MSEYGELVVGDEKVETGGEHKDWREILRDAERMERMDKVMAVARYCNRRICDICPLSDWGAPCYRPFALTDKELDEAIQSIKKYEGFTESAKADEPMKRIVERVKEKRSEYNTIILGTDRDDMLDYYDGCRNALDWVLGILESEGVNA